MTAKTLGIESHGGYGDRMSDVVSVRDRSALTARELIGRRRSIPVVDPGALRADIDALLDPTR